MLTRPSSIARRAIVSLAAVAALALAGCVEDFPDAKVSQGDVRAAIVKGTLTSPRAASVAMASLEGAPASVASRFTALFHKEAADREITVADTTTARYLVRGYLSAAPTDGGTTFTYVYDIFDAARRRIDRVTDTLAVPGTGSDPWAGVDDRALGSLAGHSADGLAIALSGMPEAQAGGRAVTASAAAPIPHAN